MVRRSVILAVISAVILVVGCLPKPVINVPAPQININVPVPGPTANQPATTPSPQPVAPGMSTQMAVQMFPYVFSYVFTLNGYWIWTENLKPGEWTKFLVTTYGDGGEENTVEVEKAFLKKLPDGKEWWRISYISNSDTVIYEALISPDRGELLRLRVKVPGSEPGEVPVTKETGYMQPIELTEESIQGATIGTETVKVPAGTFRAKHARYRIPGSSTIDWWYVDNVPGGVVKYEIRDENGHLVVTGDLKAFGSGATTMLGSF